MANFPHLHLFNNTMRSRDVIFLYLIASIIAVPSSAVGEVYKYMDADGRWQYSDRPPSNFQEADVVRGTKSRAEETRDLDTYLNKKIIPKTPVQKAALSVITIETDSITGAGFFVTDDGYILTNKHVVRPKNTGVWKDREKQMDEAKTNLSRMEEDLQDRRNRMKRTERDMAQLQAIVNGHIGSIKIRAQHDYDQLRSFHVRQQKEYWKVQRAFKQQKKQYREHENELRRKSLSSSIQRNYGIIFHDGSKKTARLISISRDHDLALLKLDGYRTPALRSSESGSGGLGAPVYAVGTPLGLSGAMTSGVITGKKDELIVTDAEMLPGNSGGPLITGEGIVIGVNTARMVAHGQSAFTEGFGLAIPISIAMKEFPEIR